MKMPSVMRSLAAMRLPIVLPIVFLTAVTVPALAQPSYTFLQGQGTLKVMTYNVDVGTEYAGMLDHDLNTFLQAASNMVLAIRASDPPGRAEAVAREIAATMPHLVSLQEVSTMSTGPTKDNLVMESDYLQLLLQALADRGAQYVAVASMKTWDATVPTTTGFARSTWSVVLLARADLDPADFAFSGARGGTFTATFVPHLYALDGHPDLCPVPVKADGTCRMPWPRGWTYVDVFYRDKVFRIIGAHLDSASPSLEIPQGLELLNGPANTSLPVIVAADLNCDCSNASDPTYQTCVNFGKAGFIDSWAAAKPSAVGYTKYLPLVSQRSDYVMAKGRFKVQGAAIVGNQVTDKTLSGLWPSDHAGVVARLQSPATE